MSFLLAKIGIPLDLQHHLAGSLSEDNGSLHFNYGDTNEVFSERCHQIPSTSCIWVAGSPWDGITKTVIVSHSAIECIASLTLNRHRLGRLEDVSLVATGLKPSFSHAKIINSFFPNSKIVMVFGKDLFGSLADITIATGILRIPVIFAMEQSGAIVINYRTQQYSMPYHKVSLSNFERTVKRRLDTRTFKAKTTDSFIELLIKG
jgi:hypothetical protein